MKTVKIHTFDDAVSLVTKKELGADPITIKAMFDQSKLPRDILDELALEAARKGVIIAAGGFDASESMLDNKVA